jgi:hypothetical protein
MTVLKLLEPSIDRYRVKLQLQHTGGSHDEDPVVGFFINLAFAEHPGGGKEYSFLSVGYTDKNLSDINGPVKPAKVKVSSNCYTAEPGQKPGFHQLNPPIATQELRGVNKILPGPWRTIIVSVTPDEFVVFWDPRLDPSGWPASTAEPLVSLTREQLHQHRNLHARGLQAVGQVLGRPFSPLPEWSPRYGIGVWADEADLAVKNFVIEPQ